MSIGIGDTSGGTGTSVSSLQVTHTIDNELNRVLVVLVGCEDNVILSICLSLV